MNSPFDQQPPEAPVINLMQAQEEKFNTAIEAQSAHHEEASEVGSAPSVGGGSKKKLLLLLLVVALLFAGAAAFFLLSSDEPAPRPIEAPVTASVAPVAPVGDTTVPTGPLQDAAPAAAVSPCEQRMIDYATQNGADPKAYVAQNQAYLAECTKAMEAGAK